MHARTERGPARRLAWWMAILVALSLVAAACGGDDDDTAGDATGDEGTEAEGEASDVDPNGVLTFGTNIAGTDQGFSFDPATSTLNTDLPWISLVLGTLARENDEGIVEPWLAESIEVVDPQTITITVRDDITYTDGAKLDAEAVRTGLLRTRDQATEASAASRHIGFKSLQDVIVDGPNQVTVKLSEPFAGEFVQAMASREGAIVSPKQAALPIGEVDKNPAAAGPYVVADQRRAQLISLKKNPAFPEADDWRIAELRWVQAPDGPAAVTGLTSNEVDMIIVPPVDVDTVEADGRFSVISRSIDGGYVTMPLCGDRPPFDDLKVRQAVQKAIDREEIVELVYDGRAEPAYALWPEGHAYFNPENKELNSYDPERARELLQEAGVSDVSFDLWLLQGIGYDRMAEVVQAQLKDVGITMNIETTANIFAEYEKHRPGGTMIPNIRQRVDKYNRFFQEGTVSVWCGARPDIMDVVNPTAALQPDDPAVAEAFKTADRMWAEDANPIPLVFLPEHIGFSKDKVGGEPQFAPSLPAAQGIRFDSFYIKK